MTYDERNRSKKSKKNQNARRKENLQLLWNIGNGYQQTRGEKWNNFKRILQVNEKTARNPTHQQQHVVPPVHIFLLDWLHFHFQTIFIRLPGSTGGKKSSSPSCHAASKDIPDKLSRHSSLSFIASGRSLGLHPVSSHSCCMYVQAGRPVFVRAYGGVHGRTSFMSSFMLL